MITGKRKRIAFAIGVLAAALAVALGAFLSRPGGGPDPGRKISSEMGCGVLEFGLPTIRATGENTLGRDAIRFWLEGFLVDGSPPLDATGEKIRVSCDQVAPSVRHTLASWSGQGGDETFRAMKDEISELYLGVRAVRRYPVKIVGTLAEFERETGFKNWSRQIIDQSEIKGRTRAFYRRQEVAAVAQTHVSKTGDISTPVQETEVIVRREDGGGDWDFYVYGEEGKLKTTSRLASPSGSPDMVANAPYACMTCHYYRLDGRFQVQPLNYRSRAR
ncbi:MAG: hypothetical protein ACRERE_11535 [Candidatus Entotheonellia bacterium]